jgi:hypothetical protein
MAHDTEVNPASEPSLREYEPAPVVRADHAEGTLTRLIERQTAKVPSDAFLFLALGSMAVSLGLELAGRKSASRFVGMWAPTLLTMGVYNKLVKTLGPR